MGFSSRVPLSPKVISHPLLCSSIYIYICLYIYIYVCLNISLQVRRSSKTWSLAKDQVLRGPLVYLGLIELSPFSHHVHRRQVFSTLVLIAPPISWYQSH